MSSSQARPQAGRRRFVQGWMAWAAGGVVLVAVVLGFSLSHGGARPQADASGIHSGAGYRLTSVTGQAVTIPAGRPTVLYFMSASCSSCWQGSSQLAQAYAALRTKAQVVSLDVTPQVDTASQVETMAQETGARWPQTFATSALLTRYHVESLDTVVVLSPTGRVVYDGSIPSNAQLLALVTRAAQ